MDKSYFLKWIKAAGMRAVKTFAQVMIAMIGTEYVSVSEVNWIHCVSVAGVAAILSILTSLAGLPEVKMPDISTIAKETSDPEDK